MLHFPIISLTWSLNKRQTIRTVTREVLNGHMAHKGPTPPQFDHAWFRGRGGHWGGTGGAQSRKIGYFWTRLLDFAGHFKAQIGLFWTKWKYFDLLKKFWEVHIPYFGEMGARSWPSLKNEVFPIGFRGPNLWPIFIPESVLGRKNMVLHY